MAICLDLGTAGFFPAPPYTSTASTVDHLVRICVGLLSGLLSGCIWSSDRSAACLCGHWQVLRNPAEKVKGELLRGEKNWEAKKTWTFAVVVVRSDLAV